MRTANYVHGGISWREYLQAREFESSLKESLSDSASRIVASNEEIARHIDSAVNLTVGAIKELGAIFTWGFGEILGELVAINSTLRTPSQTWAYEQFHVAQEAFRKSLFPEARRYVRNAIAGFGSNTGFDLEWRFHYLEGTILLGSFVNADADDPAAAERAFLKAARYAEADSVPDATRSFTAASQAAYVQGDLVAAIAHAKAAIALCTTFGEANYQMAKYLFHQNNVAGARAFVTRALEADPEYALRMLADGDYRRHERAVIQCIEDYRDAVRSRLLRRAEMQQPGFAEVEGGARGNDRSLVATASQFMLPLRRAESAGTLLSWITAEQAYDTARQTVVRSARATAEQLDRDAKAIAQWNPPAAATVAAVVGFFGSWNLGCYAARNGWDAPEGLGSLLMIVLFGVIGALAYFGVAVLHHFPKTQQSEQMQLAAKRLRAGASALLK
jgi:tetratricopeptide (TPR) repeat protein